MKFLNTPQGYTNRIDLNLTAPNIGGMFTGRFSTCLIINISSRVTGRMSLTHADPSVRESDIQAEIDWVGAGAEKAIMLAEPGAFPMENTLFDVLPNIYNQFHLMSFPKKVLDTLKGISVGRNFKVTGHYTHERSRLPELICRRDQEKADDIRYINELTNTLTFPRPDAPAHAAYSRIIFDGRSWCDLPAEDLALNETAKRRMTYFRDLTPASNERDWKNAFARMWLNEASLSADPIYKEEYRKMALTKEGRMMQPFIVRLMNRFRGDLTPLLDDAAPAAGLRA